MLTVIIRQKVKDLAVWKSSFAEGAAMRDGVGAKIWSAAHEVDEDNTVVVVSDWPSLESARVFLDNARETFAKSGAVAIEIRVFDSEIKL
jgi:hypothetical protein